MKKLLFAICFLAAMVSCKKDDDNGPITVNFLLENDLLWNIGHNYSAGGIDENGDSFTGESVYVNYYGVLLQDQMIKKNTSVTLYKNGNAIWTSESLSKSCTINYSDQPSPWEDIISIQ